MRNTRTKLRMKLNDLAKLTDISPARLSKLEMLRAVPTEKEKLSLMAALNNTELTFARSKEDADREDKHLKEIITAFNGVFQHTKNLGLGKGRGGRGTMPCPLCKKELHFRVAGINGHLWAKCETENCVCVVQ